jgi:hypothetical protein
MNKFSTSAALMTAAMLSAHAHAGHKEECERPDYARQYAAAFPAELNGALDKFNAQDALHKKKIDAMKAAMIKAGAWSDMEAATFMVKASITDEDAKAAEAGRKKAASDFKVQLLTIQGIEVVAGGDKAAEVRATCLLGPNAITKADALRDAIEKAWSLLEAKIVAVAQEKNITLP